MSDQVLVAGIGNIFLADDGFGPEVVRRLVTPAEPLPADVRVIDYGIRGLHLLYDLLDGYQALVIVDALPGRGDPGQVTVLEVALEDVGRGGDFDPHGMNPVAVLSGLPGLGCELPPTYLVGAAPEDLDEGIGLSATMADAVPVAVETVRELLALRPWATSHLAGARGKV